MRNIKYFIIFVICCMLFTGCQNNSTNIEKKEENRSVENDSSVEKEDESSEVLQNNDSGIFPAKVPEFETLDIKGNTVNHNIFSDKKITMVNIWGTYCGPCIDEMPDLGELSRALPKEAQIAGLVIDVAGDVNLDTANTIVDSSEADFTHMIINEDLNNMIENIMGVPTSFFVDENGNIVGDFILGARSKEDYLAAIEGLLKE